MLNSCKKDKDIYVTGLSLNKTYTIIMTGNSETLEATVSPSDAIDKSLTWSSSDVSVATVNEGTVTALKEGKAVITVTAANGKIATCNVTVMEPFSSGDGSSDAPYLINNAADLGKLSDLVNAGDSIYAAAGKWYRLTDNITLPTDSLGESNFTPIGTQTNRFHGNFDGNGKTIDSLTINTASGYAGLFGWVRDGIIQNLGLTNVSISGGRYTGGIAGLIQNWFSDSGITGCYVTGSVSGTSNVGGIAGFIGNNSSIMGCYVYGSVSSTSSNVGGIVGYASGTVSNCYTTCSVSSTWDSVGGIAGNIYGGSISNCYATGDISGINDCGGIAGANLGTVSDCVALNPRITRVSGDFVSFGRVVGYGTGSLTNNAAFSDMTADGGINFSSGDNNGTDITAAVAKTQSTYSDSPRNWTFGVSIESPWRWGLSSSYPLPTLYWQAAASTLPAHLN